MAFEICYKEWTPKKHLKFERNAKNILKIYMHVVTPGILGCL